MIEAKEIRRLAREADLSVSESLRKRARGEAFGTASIQLIECGDTGSLAFLGGPEFNPLDTGAVRQMLSDSP